MKLWSLEPATGKAYVSLEVCAQDLSLKLGKPNLSKFCSGFPACVHGRLACIHLSVGICLACLSVYAPLVRTVSVPGTSVEPRGWN